MLNQIVYELPEEHPLSETKPLREILGHTVPQVRLNSSYCHSWCSNYFVPLQNNVQYIWRYLMHLFSYSIFTTCYCPSISVISMVFSSSCCPLYHHHQLITSNDFPFHTRELQQSVSDTCNIYARCYIVLSLDVSGCGRLHPWNPDGYHYELSSGEEFLVKWCSWILATHVHQISRWWWLVKCENMISLVCLSGWIIRIYEVLTDVDQLYIG